MQIVYWNLPYQFPLWNGNVKLKKKQQPPIFVSTEYKPGSDLTCLTCSHLSSWPSYRTGAVIIPVEKNKAHPNENNKKLVTICYKRGPALATSHQHLPLVDSEAVRAAGKLAEGAVFRCALKAVAMQKQDVGYLEVEHLMWFVWREYIWLSLLGADLDGRATKLQKLAVSGHILTVLDWRLQTVVAWFPGLVAAQVDS